MDRRSTRRKSTQDTAEDTQPARARDDNARQRQLTALDMRSQGHNFDAIAAKCGYSHRSAARKAWQRAVADLAEDTAEESRLLFKASYGPVRVALHRWARMGDVRAVEALVKLDERECRLFGLDISPEDASLHVQYTKRIVLEETVTLPAPSPEHSENGSIP